MANSLSYWLAIDSNLDPYRFRVTCYTNMYETGLMCEYGSIKYQRFQGEIIARIYPKGKSPIRMRFQEDDNTDQILLCQLVFWYSGDYFLAVPDTDTPTETTDTLF